MALDDLLPDDESATSSANTSQSKSSSSSSKEKTDEEEEFAKVVGSPPNQKKFTEEKWKEVKLVIREEFGYSVGEVLSSPASERYEILHEAAMFPVGKLDEDESEHYQTSRCEICGSAETKDALTIEGKVFCPHHTVGQLKRELGT